MLKRIFIILISIFYYTNAQENRLFWDGREWNSIRKQVKYVDEMEHKIKSTKTWSENAMLANDVFGEQVDYLTVRQVVKNLNHFYEDPLNSYIPIPSAIVIANLYGKRVPLDIIEKYIKDSRDWVNSLTIELDTLDYSKLIEEKYLKTKKNN